MGKRFQSAFTAIAVSALAGLYALPPAQAADTKDRILSEKKLVAGIHNGKPWGYNTPDGNVEGFNVDVVRAVFEPLGVKEIKFVTGDFGSLIPGLLSNRFDIVDSAVVITEERCKLVSFGDPELTSVDALLVKKGNPNKIASFNDVIRNPQLKIGGSRGSQQAKNAELAGVTGDQLQLFQNTESTISALVAGRVDGITFTSGTANALLATPQVAASVERATPFTGRTDANGKLVVSYVAAVFRPQDEDLRTLFNKRLAELKADGTIAKIMAKYGFSPDEKAPDGLTSTEVCAGKK
ncbi:ectoine/hydroxyectoine ABC transporter substrate-binding protein EhuB [Xanthobacter tagetidis]|uniref:Ectoine/hydroxyectoine ABC transporter substrate-binding protein EhuB n=1 Tax=Xanthobacter tagetidis TaxID=60216 RepID=A0A3L7AGV0_9HYPH|nr:ectoine/hydroxyectoine ABC transporter substrate-binding protein EhuB [Xanthobacter tagetidis]MBB6308593.1 polar amino acid transport system substrate-binding protein [Xanthobacter tagetidis]RLP78642.1 ectoine/hydroxyectoine ABC transporter substrate-binding protein EhuB [Xanthobacter tagetidis]